MYKTAFSKGSTSVTIISLLLVLAACATTNKTNLIVPTPTSSPDNVSKSVELVSKYDENFKIVNMMNPESLINNLNYEAFFDFDNELIISDKTADVYLSISCGTDCFDTLIEVNGAKAVRMQDSSPGFLGCKNALSASQLNGISLTIGRYSCLLTNEDKIVEIFIISNKLQGYDSSVIIQFQVWENE